MVTLQNATYQDISKIMAAERHEDNVEYVQQYTYEQHLAAMDDPNVAHLKVLNAKLEFVGFIILAGITDPYENIEFKRIAITEKGKGYGTASLQLVQQLAFEEWNCHRLWLDVFDFNKRAFHVYKKLGFAIEGTKREWVKVGATRKTTYLMSMLKTEYKIQEVSL